MAAQARIVYAFSTDLLVGIHYIFEESLLWKP